MNQIRKEANDNLKKIRQWLLVIEKTLKEDDLRSQVYGFLYTVEILKEVDEGSLSPKSIAEKMIKYHKEYEQHRGEIH